MIAEIHAKDDNGTTALIYASENGRFGNYRRAVELLVQHGAVEG